MEAFLLARFPQDRRVKAFVEEQVAEARDLAVKAGVLDDRERGREAVRRACDFVRLFLREELGLSPIPAAIERELRLSETPKELAGAVALASTHPPGATFAVNVLQLLIVMAMIAWFLFVAWVSTAKAASVATSGGQQDWEIYSQHYWDSRAGLEVLGLRAPGDLGYYSASVGDRVRDGLRALVPQLKANLAAGALYGGAVVLSVPAANAACAAAVGFRDWVAERLGRAAPAKNVVEQIAQAPEPSKPEKEAEGAAGPPPMPPRPKYEPAKPAEDAGKEAAKAELKALANAGLTRNLTDAEIARLFQLSKLVKQQQ